MPLHIARWRCVRRPTDTEHRQPVARFMAQGQLSTDAAARSRSQWKITWRLMSPPSIMAAAGSTTRFCLTRRFDLCPSARTRHQHVHQSSPQLRFNDLLSLRGEVRSATHAHWGARMAPIWIAAGRVARADPAAGPGWQAVEGARRHGTGMWAQPASRRGALPRAGHVGQAEYTFPCSGPRNLCSEADMIHRNPAPAIVPRESC
jgi:hypothetical protein